MLANIEALRAEELLTDPAAYLTPDAIYELTLIATGDPDKAARARGKAWHQARVEAFKHSDRGL